MRGYLLFLLLLFHSFFVWVQDATTELHDSFEKVKFQDINKAYNLAARELKLAKKNSVSEVNALIDMGFSLYYMDNYTAGETHLKRAVSIGKKIHYGAGVALAEYHLGALTILEGRYAESVTHLNTASVIFDSLNNTEGKALCLNSLGEICMFQGNFSKAERNFKNALQLGSKQTLGDSYVLLAQLFYRTESPEKSYDFANKAYDWSLKYKDLYVEATALDLIAAYESKKGMTDKALQHLHMSVRIKETLRDKQGVSSTFIELGKLKLTANQKDSAYYFLRKAYALSNGVGAKEDIKRSSILLSRIFALDNRYDSAYFYQERFVSMNTVLLQDNATRQIDEMAAKAKEKDQQNRIELFKKQQEIERKNKYTLLQTGSLIIIFLFGLVVALLNRNRLRRHNISELARWTNFQETLLEISSKYINITEDKINASINESLAFIGRFLEVDRVYIFEYNHEKFTTSNTYEWCAKGIEPEIENLQEIPFDYIPDWVNLHFQNQDMFIENVDLLEDGSLKEILQPQGIKSLLALPMFSGGKCIGFVGFDSVNSLKAYSKDERHLMKVFSEMLVNIFERSKYIETIQNAQKDIQRYNGYLEEMVEIETRKNIELTKSIADQEKLVTIGEISSGIAHDLNTPLGSAQIGLESIDYIVKKLFEESIPNLTYEEIQTIYAIAQQRKLEFFQSTFKVREEILKFNTLLTAEFSLNEEDTESLSKLFVQSQIKDDERELISRILDLPNRKQSLNMLFMLLNMRNLIDSSIISTQRAAEVVGNLKTFIKSPENDLLKDIHLHSSLQSVLSIFNHEIRNKVILEFDVASNLVIKGYEVKLFQLWSNLIKNALEAMQQSNERKLIIRASEQSNSIHVAISNTGEMIPAELREKIFDKFFSTKTHKSGTGLGLSIVKTIIEEHNARLDLESNEDLTTFVVTFKK